MRISAIKTPRIADGMLIRKVQGADRPSIVDLIEAAGNLTGEERSCAAELLDMYLNDPLQKDYSFLAASDTTGGGASSGGSAAGGSGSGITGASATIGGCKYTFFLRTSTFTVLDAPVS